MAHNARWTPLRHPLSAWVVEEAGAGWESMRRSQFEDHASRTSLVQIVLSTGALARGRDRGQRPSAARKGGQRAAARGCTQQGGAVWKGMLKQGLGRIANG
jgi:hypothetical protein